MKFHPLKYKSYKRFFFLQETSSRITRYLRTIITIVCRSI